MSFEGKVIIVTGSSSGIGAETAVMFCKEGANVAIVGRNEDKLKSTSERCTQAGGNHIVFKADVAKDEDAERIVKETVEKFGKLDVLINNAAIMRYGSFGNGQLLQAYDSMVNINLRATIHLCALAEPHLIKTRGNIINISSAAGIRFTSPNLVSYGLIKAGLNHFTTGAAKELAPFGVRVNTISPGPVATDIMGNAGVDIKWEQVAELTALKRFSEPSEIGELILFVASEKARGITGSNFLSDNGFLLK